MNKKTFTTAIELNGLMKNRAVTVLDVRSIPEYNEGHIWEAVNLPIESLPQSAAAIPNSTTIVTVCNKGGGRSEEAALLLTQNGWTNATWLEGGYMSWVDAGFSDYEAGFSS